MSAHVFPENPGYMPNSMSHKVEMENGRDQTETKQEGKVLCAACRRTSTA